MATPRLPRLLAPTAVLIAGLIIGAMAIRSVVAELILLPGNQVLVDIRRGIVADPVDLERAAATRERALWLAKSSRILTDLGLLRLKLAEESDSPIQRRRLLIEARRSVADGLREAPGNPFAWSRLAFIQLQLTDPSRTVAESVVMSVRTGQNERRLVFSRAGMMFAVWDHLNVAERALAAEQVRLSWRLSRVRIAKIALDAKRTDLLLEFIGDSREVGHAIGAVGRSF